MEARTLFQTLASMIPVPPFLMHMVCVQSLMNTDERSTKIICEAIQWFVYCFQVSLESFITDFDR